VACGQPSSSVAGVVRRADRDGNRIVETPVLAGGTTVLLPDEMILLAGHPKDLDRFVADA